MVQVYQPSTITKTVTGSNKYFIDGSQQPTLNLYEGHTYKFDQSDGTNSGHPLRFYLDANKTTAYTTGVTTNGTPGQAGAYTQIVVASGAPTLHYQCSWVEYTSRSRTIWVISFRR